MSALFQDNYIQFVRLLAEINAAGLPIETQVQIEESGGYEGMEIDNVLERAEVAWEAIKKEMGKEKG